MRLATIAKLPVPCECVIPAVRGVADVLLREASPGRPMRRRSGEYVAAGQAFSFPVVERKVHPPRLTQHQEEPEMNWMQIEGKWVELMGQARTRWAKLTEEDLRLAEGKFDKLVGKVVERYGIAKEQARAEVNVWADRLGDRIEDAGRMAEKKAQSASETLKGGGAH